MKDLDHEQLALELPNTSAPKRGIRSGQLVVDRSACPTTRPCRKFSCPHHLWVEDERRGRPHNGKSPPSKLVERADSCALDIAERGDHTTAQVARTMQLTPDRVNQLEDRGLAKVHAATLVQRYVEDTLPKLPEGVTLELVMPEQLDAHRMVLALVIKVDGTAWRRAQERGGAFVRRRRKP